MFLVLYRGECFSMDMLSKYNDALTQLSILRQQINSLENENYKLREKATQNHNHLDVLPVPCQSLDINGKIIDVNSAWLTELGYSRDEVVGQWFGDFVLPSFLEHYRDIFEKAKDTGSSANVRLALLRKNKLPLLVSFDSNAVFSEDGVFDRTYCIFKDLSNELAMEEALSFERQQILSLYDTIDEAIYVADIHTNEILYVNKFAANYFGDDAIGKKCYKLFHDLDNPCPFCTNNALLSDKTKSLKWEHHNELVNRDFLCYDRFIKWVDGRDARFELTIDITDLKSTSKALTETEQLYRTLYDSSNDGILIMDGDNIVDCNPRTCELFGLKKDQLIGKSPAIFSTEYQPDDTHSIKKAQDILDKAYREPQLLEWFHVKSDGTPFYVEVFVKTIEINNKTMLLALLHDITARKQNEQILQESEERLRLTLNGTNQGFWEVNYSDHSFYFSDTMFTMLGYKPVKPDKGPAFFRFIHHPDDIHYFEEALDRIFSGNTDIFQYQSKFKANNGEYRTILSNGKVISRDVDGKPLRVVGTHTDITDRLRLESQLHQAQKMETIGRLAGGISHDFNNILTVISGHAELALAKIDEDSDLYEDIEDIYNTAERASRLTRQLLAFSRRQIVEPKVIDINSELMTFDKMLRRIIGEDIELLFLPEESIWPVRIDTIQIEQVITNLVINSRDAMPDGGKLVIETKNTTLDETYPALHIGSEPGDYVMIAVTDNGFGMDTETVDKIFEPFFTTKGHGKGTGLGLSTCYGIVKQNGGNIWVYSEPGQGTTVKIYLPRVFSPLDEESVQTEIVTSSGSESILVVEDEESLRMIIHRILTDNGYDVQIASNGDEALRTLKQTDSSVDLVLTDMIMPHMGGRELAENLRSMMPQLRILFMTGYTDNAMFHNGMLDSDVQLIQKPFTPASLLQKIREILENV